MQAQRSRFNALNVQAQQAGCLQSTTCREFMISVCDVGAMSTPTEFETGCGDKEPSVCYNSVSAGKRGQSPSLNHKP